MESEPQRRKPIVHRKPVLATVRQLYGTAFRCGKPGCGRLGAGYRRTVGMRWSAMIKMRLTAGSGLERPRPRSATDQPDVDA